MWDNAYLEQARSDWKTYNIIEEYSDAACHGLHYLQMTTEKLGKAALLRSGSSKLDSVQQNHRGFTSLLRMVSRSSALQYEFKMNSSQLKQHIQEMLPVAYVVEHLAPALANKGPNAEYPWETPTREVICPASFVFPVVQELRSPKGLKLLKLITTLLNKFDSFF